MKIQSKHIIAWLGSCAAHFTEQQDFLTALDRDIGDADHGLNMNRGFSAVKATLPDIERQHIDNILKNTGMKLLSSVGGASGPLYGTLFIRTSAAIGARTELSLEEWLACLEEGIAGVIARGKAEQGDKTLCDVWVPVLNEAKKNLQAGMSPSLLLNTWCKMLQQQSITPSICRRKKDEPATLALVVWVIRIQARPLPG